MNNKNIGKRIYEIRTRKNYTQEEFAEKLGSASTYISNIERGNRVPSLTLLSKIVKELDTSYDYILLDDFNTDRRLELRCKDLLKEVENLDKKTQDEFFIVVHTLLKSMKNIEKDSTKK